MKTQALRSNIFDIGTGNAAAVSFDLKSTEEAQARITFYQQLNVRINHRIKQVYHDYNKSDRVELYYFRLLIDKNGFLQWQETQDKIKKIISLQANSTFKELLPEFRETLIQFDKERLLLNMQLSINLHIIKTLKKWVELETIRKA